MFGVKGSSRRRLTEVVAAHFDEPSDPAGLLRSDDIVRQDQENL
jgi:hypothetical protein